MTGQLARATASDPVKQALARQVLWEDLGSLQPLARQAKYNKSSWSRALAAASRTSTQNQPACNVSSTNCDPRGVAQHPELRFCVGQSVEACACETCEDQEEGEWFRCRVSAIGLDGTISVTGQLLPLLTAIPHRVALPPQMVRVLRTDTALHVAAYEGNEDAVTQLIAEGASLNAPGELSQTALHDAAIRGHAVVVQLLLSASADPNALTERSSEAKECYFRGCPIGSERLSDCAAYGSRERACRGRSNTGAAPTSKADGL